MNRMMTTIATAMTATLLSMTAASATVFLKDYHDAGVWNAYDDQTQTYSMKFKDDGSKDGFWLVVSPGENPKANANEYAILYGDRNTNRITAYSYDGNDNANSFQTGQYLGTFENAFTDGGKHARLGYDMTMFSLDVSGINNAFGDAGWIGTSFAEQQGIWFHQSADSQFAYNADGTLSNYAFGSQMWVDTANEATWQASCGANNTNAYYCQNGTTLSNPGGANPAPAPGGLALVLLGLAGFGLRRKT